MRTPTERNPGEAGGITILVSLMMLVFITLTAVGMSRNSFREVVISGTTRQGALARNLADTGMEWSIFWMEDKNRAIAPTGAEANLNTLRASLLQANGLSGKAWDLMNPGVLYVPDSATAAKSLTPVTSSAGTVMNQSFAAGLTRMGKLPIANQSQGVGDGSFKPATGEQSNLLPDLWAFRADARVSVVGVTFNHAKELWVSTAISQ